MSKVHIEPIEMYGWQAQRMSCGPLKIVLAPSIGGRIISLRFEGREYLYSDKEHHGETFDFAQVEDLNARKKEMGFRLWGGDKTWVAPQNEWQEGIPPLELDAGPYELTWNEQEAVMTSPVCRETGLRIIRRVRMDEEQTVHLTEELHNMSSDRIVRKGIWNVTQVLRPCTFFIPAPKGAFRSYHVEDKTLPPVEDIFTENEDWVEIPCRTDTLFKCGGFASQGQVLIKMPLGGPREVVWLKTFTLDVQAEYAHRSVVEVFNSDKNKYAEIELHTSVTEIPPNNFTQFQQQWRFKKI